MPFCSACGEPLKEGDRLCPACAAPVPPKPGPREVKPILSLEPRPSPRVLPGILLTGGIFVILALIFLLSGRGKEPSPTPPPPAASPAAPQADQAAKPTVTPGGETPAQLNLAGLQAYQAGNLEEAKDLFLKAAKADPANAKAWNNLGLALRQLERTPEAVEAYRRGLKAQPHFDLTYKNLGVALEQLGDKTAAAQAYLRYCQLAPDAADADQVRQWAENLLK